MASRRKPMTARPQYMRFTSNPFAQLFPFSFSSRLSPPAVVIPRAFDRVLVSVTWFSDLAFSSVNGSSAPHYLLLHGCLFPLRLFPFLFLISCCVISTAESFTPLVSASSPWPTQRSNPASPKFPSLVDSCQGVPSRIPVGPGLAVAVSRLQSSLPFVWRVHLLAFDVPLLEPSSPFTNANGVILENACFFSPDELHGARLQNRSHTSHPSSRELKSSLFDPHAPLCSVTLFARPFSPRDTGPFGSPLSFRLSASHVFNLDGPSRRLIVFSCWRVTPRFFVIRKDFPIFPPCRKAVHSWPSDHSNGPHPTFLRFFFLNSCSLLLPPLFLISLHLSCSRMSLLPRFLPPLAGELFSLFQRTRYELAPLILS